MKKKSKKVQKMSKITRRCHQSTRVEHEGRRAKARGKTGAMPPRRAPASYHKWGKPESSDEE